MKFIDANVFIYAFSRVRRELKPHEILLKANARKIIERVIHGEKVITSVVHISEVMNYIEEISLDMSIELLENLLSNENIRIMEVNVDDYFNAKELAKEFQIGVNDCVAIHIMEKYHSTEIYSFDKDFDIIHSIKRIQE